MTNQVELGQWTNGTDGSAPEEGEQDNGKKSPTKKDSENPERDRQPANNESTENEISDSLIEIAEQFEKARQREIPIADRGPAWHGILRSHGMNYKDLATRGLGKNSYHPDDKEDPRWTDLFVDVEYRPNIGNDEQQDTEDSIVLFEEGKPDRDAPSWLQSLWHYTRQHISESKDGTHTLVLENERTERIIKTAFKFKTARTRPIPDSEPLDPTWWHTAREYGLCPEDLSTIHWAHMPTYSYNYHRDDREEPTWEEHFVDVSIHTELSNNETGD